MHDWSINWILFCCIKSNKIHPEHQMKKNSSSEQNTIYLEKYCIYTYIIIIIINIVLFLLFHAVQNKYRKFMNISATHFTLLTCTIHHQLIPALIYKVANAIIYMIKYVFTVESHMQAHLNLRYVCEKIDCVYVQMSGVCHLLYCTLFLFNFLCVCVQS